MNRDFMVLEHYFWDLRYFCLSLQLNCFVNEKSILTIIDIVSNKFWKIFLQFFQKDIAVLFFLAPKFLKILSIQLTNSILKRIGRSKHRSKHLLSNFFEFIQKCKYFRVMLAYLLFLSLKTVSVLFVSVAHYFVIELGKQWFHKLQDIVFRKTVP